MTPPALSDFPFTSVERIRYADTDRQGHVNNAVFATYLETGRIDFLFEPSLQLVTTDTNYVVASLRIDYLAEILWPGEVTIGTKALKVGNSSLTVSQCIYQQTKCVATAETVIVQVNKATRKSQPLSALAKESLAKSMG